MSKPLSPGHASRVVTIRLTGPQLARLRELGGAAWVRRQIAAAPLYEAAEQKIIAASLANWRAVPFLVGEARALMEEAREVAP